MSKMNSYRKTATLFAATAVIAVGSALAFQHYTNASAQPAEAPPAVMPATPVSVKTVSPDDVMIWSEFSGRMNAVDFAEIRPQVSGRITQVRFADGQSVKAGAVLFVIDPRPFEAALAKAEANLVTARTNADFANTEFERAAVLIKSGLAGQKNGLIGHTTSSGRTPSQPTSRRCAKPTSERAGSNVQAVSVPELVRTPSAPKT